MKTLSRKIYSASFIFSLGIALSAYINSSFLENAVGEKSVGLVYSVSAFLLLLALAIFPAAIKRFGNKISALFILSLNALSLLVLIFGKSPSLIVPAFIAYLLLNSLTFFSLDIFVEHFSKERSVGQTRGFYLTLNNLAWVFGPFAAGVIASSVGLNMVYGFSLCFVALVFCLIISIDNFEDKKYERISLLSAFKKISGNKILLGSVLINFILQFFYALMVIYMPIHLREDLGFDFKTIGLIFTGMLSAFVILQLPLGKLADKKTNEPRIIFFGALVGAIATIFAAYLHSLNPYIWALVLFFTRVGAASVEVMTETYFFRHIREKDAEVLSVFRDMYPLAYILAPLFATFILKTSSFETLFVILGIIFASGALIALTLPKNHSLK